MASWIEDIIQAMKNLGGQAKYEDLYDEVKRVRNQSLPKTWRAIVRNQVESHSSDSDNYRENRTDYFYSVYGKGKGVWALRREHRDESRSANQISDPKQRYEGKSTEVTLTHYERDPGARKECLEHYGYSCTACDFNFENVYGEIGKGFIHVHHLVPISQFGDEYEINAIKDLRPVCPNCHAMLHQESPPVSIEELKAILRA